MKKTPKISKILYIVIGLLLAEGLLPVASAMPFAIHDGIVLHRAVQGPVNSDLTLLTQLHDQHPGAFTAAPAQTTAYRQNLLDAASKVKTALGVIGLSPSLIGYLSNHPGDTELQTAGLEAVQRGQDWEDKKFADNYARLDNEEHFARLSWWMALWAPRFTGAHTQIQHLMDSSLASAQEGIRHPKEFLAARRKEVDDALKLTQPASNHTGHLS
jgi:hypothetical protein